MFNYGKIFNCVFFSLFRLVLFSVICRLESESSVARCIAIRLADNDEWNERCSLIKQCDLQLNKDNLNAKRFKINNKK